MVVGIAGSHLSGKIITSTLDIEGEVITEELQKEIISRCHITSQGMEILHNIPLTFQVDNREHVDSAIGFSGDFLKCESFIIEADRNYMKDVVRLCNNCGLSIQKLYAEPYASASVTVPYSMKQSGVAVADIGGGTTDGIVFKNGKPIKIFTVNIAGQLITNDLAIGLQISENNANTLKHRFGLEKEMDLVSIEKSNGQYAKVHSSLIYKILSCRVDELYQLISKELGVLMKLLQGGIILTGGGSELKGITNHFFKNLGIITTKIQPEIPKISNQTKNPGNRTAAATKFATVAGLLYLALEDFGPEKSRGPRVSRYLKTFVNWLKEIS